MIERVLVLRAPSGISGDMLVAGLADLAGYTADGLEAIIARLDLPELAGTVRLEPRCQDGLTGLGLSVALPPSPAHRHLADIRAIIAASHLTEEAKALAGATFDQLAEAEAAVHGTTPEHVHFHEVGALDSLLDVCLACALFAELAPARFVCSPLPVCDGTVRCAHGLLATPAPAVLHLLRDVPIYGLDSQGETVTPTGAALLRSLGATFGGWPELTLRRHVRVYGTRRLPGVPNGALFALGEADTRPAHTHGPLPATDSDLSVHGEHPCDC